MDPRSPIQRLIEPSVMGSEPRIFNNPPRWGPSIDRLVRSRSCPGVSGPLRWVYNGRASRGAAAGVGAAAGGRPYATVEALDAWDHHAGVAGGPDERAAR